MRSVDGPRVLSLSLNYMLIFGLKVQPKYFIYFKKITGVKFA